VCNGREQFKHINKYYHKMQKRTLYVDMDNVLVDFQSGLDKIENKLKEEYKGHEDDIPHIFSNMKPMPGAINSYNLLAEHFDVYILTTAPWENPTALTDKRDWVKKYLPESGYKRLIITHHKNLNKGDFIIDDRLARGVDKFEGEHIHFGSSKYPNWETVINYLMNYISKVTD
jgi:5'-nucleotidase